MLIKVTYSSVAYYNFIGLNVQELLLIIQYENTFFCWLILCVPFCNYLVYMYVSKTGCNRQYTVSIAVPGSILDNAQSAELRSYLVGQVHSLIKFVY